jgi:hypothetical protein
MEIKGQVNGTSSMEAAFDQKSLLDSSARDVFSDWLDATQGHTVNEHNVFTKLARK